MSLTILFHLALSLVRSTNFVIISSGVESLNSRYLFNDLRSFSTSFIHVRLCLPTFLLNFVNDSCRSSLTGVRSSSRIKFPNQLRLLLQIIVLHLFDFTFSYRCSFDMIFGQRMSVTLRRIFIWKESMLLSRVSVSFYSSELYRNTLAEYVLNVLSLRSVEIRFDL